MRRETVDLILTTWHPEIPLIPWENRRFEETSEQERHLAFWWYTDCRVSEAITRFEAGIGSISEIVELLRGLETASA